MKPQTWNDVLAIVFGVIILSIWTLGGTHIIELPDIILGATISCFTLIVQFYFRKAKEE
jgi:hypothetical protein